MASGSGSGSGSSQETIRVEGFSTNLRGRRIYIVGDENLLSNRIGALETELIGRGRKVLICADGRAEPKWAQKHTWDAIFRLRDITDLRLAMTYLSYAAKPVRLVWLGEEPTHVMTPKWAKEDVTLISVGHSFPRQEWDAIFFGPTMVAKHIEDALLTRMGSAKLAQFALRTVLPELQVAKAALVWSNVDEADKSGSLYWYDIAEGSSKEEPLDYKEAADFLRDLADRICSAK